MEWAVTLTARASSAPEPTTSFAFVGTSTIKVVAEAPRPHEYVHSIRILRETASDWSPLQEI